jgi:hypothetical protein
MIRIKNDRNKNKLSNDSRGRLPNLSSACRWFHQIPSKISPFPMLFLSFKKILSDPFSNDFSMPLPLPGTGSPLETARRYAKQEHLVLASLHCKNKYFIDRCTTGTTQ